MSTTRPSPALVRALLAEYPSGDAEAIAALDELLSVSDHLPAVRGSLYLILAAHIRAVAREMREYAQDIVGPYDAILRKFADRLEGKEDKL